MMEKITGCWVNESKKDGKKYLSFPMDGQKYMLFHNDYKRPGDNNPDYNLFRADPPQAQPETPASKRRSPSPA